MGHAQANKEEAEDTTAITNLIEAMLQEVEKSASADQAEVEKLKQEIEKLRSESKRREEQAMKLLEEQKKFYEEMRQVRIPEQRIQQIDPALLRKSYENKTKD